MGVMVELTLEQIAVRSAVIWSVGIVAYAGLSAAGVSTQRRLQGLSLIVIVLASVASVGAVLLGCYGAGLLIRDAVSFKGWAGPLAFAIGFIGLLWASSIIAQIARNCAYRLIGQAPKPLQWYRGQQRKSKRKKARGLTI